ncbi:HNH endonuclease [Mesorhizobium australicum]|uniref:HNH endonuclease n=1 Tax=Mesorhizobium TaxID=68287 RepID=UPI0003D00BA7|nr:HNH endonuclease [Mesorhizobium sp. LNHC209A00]ESY89298.1 HNH endonuclease [Mesorhizobium sp. LNHC209A00]
MAADITGHEFHDVLEHLTQRPFSTLQFIKKLAQRHPSKWRAIEEEYGAGGIGAKTHFSAYSRVAHTLAKFARKGLLAKLDYQPAPRGWGSPNIRYWTDQPGSVGQLFPDEVGDEDGFWEGARTKVFVNAYERNVEARAACLRHFGLACVACGEDFGRKYGAHGQGFIHVHHLVPLKKIGREYQVKPTKHLRPVCANCHAMIHRREPMLTIEQLKELLDRSR